MVTVDGRAPQVEPGGTRRNEHLAPAGRGELVPPRVADTPGMGAPALVLARRGLAVAPVFEPVGSGDARRCSCPRGARCSSPGKHPRTAHGISDATSDEATVTTWWRRWPGANIAVACGPSRLLVVDLDGPKAVAAWRELTSQNGSVATLSVRTGRGWHLWFAQPPAAKPLGNSSGKLGPGIDTRGAGGYVLAPPSRHISGHVYEWSAQEACIAPLPTWLDTALRPTPPKPARAPIASTHSSDRALVGLVQTVLDAEPGSRNTRLFWAACRAREHADNGSMMWPEAVAALSVAAAAVGLDEDEIAATLRSAARSAASNG